MSDHDFELLPTGKQHVSFSEVSMWDKCSFKHSLVHIKKLENSAPSPILVFGTAVHAACENFLLTKEMNVGICAAELAKGWKEYSTHPEFDDRSLEEAINTAQEMLLEVPQFIDSNFPNWETVDAEHELYEPIDGHKHAFKGFIDGVIKSTDKKGNPLY